jgi:hypothetical protein
VQVIQPDDPNHYMLGYNGTLKVGVLPVAWFSNGHVYFTQKMHKTLGTDPYCVHAIFQFSGTDGKRHRFREALLWVDGPEYWQAKGEREGGSGRRVREGGTGRERGREGRSGRVREGGTGRDWGREGLGEGGAAMP